MDRLISDFQIGKNTFKSCPRCGKMFECGAKSDIPCVCFSLTLSFSLKKELKKKYQDCLCVSCLTELNKAHS
ncbi:cysteine-rich CWC family protein [Leptospira sp. WS92.C1]